MNTKFTNTPIEVTLQSNIKYAYCTCGLSTKFPFCDGNHRGTEFKPIKWISTENKTVKLCRCGKSKNKPFCDGSHKTI